MGRRPEQTFSQRRPSDGQQAHEKVLNIANHQGNANQNHNEISPHTCHNVIKKITNNKYSGECGEKPTLYTVGKNVNWYSHYGEQYGGSLKN